MSGVRPPRPRSAAARSTNTYYNYVNDDTARGGNLKSTTYANGDSVATPTTGFDRLVRKSYNSGSYVAYTYNAEGLARLSYGDSTGELASYRFEYDSLGRLIRSAELDADGGTVQRTEHIHDGYNRLLAAVVDARAARPTRNIIPTTTPPTAA